MFRFSTLKSSYALGKQSLGLKVDSKIDLHFLNYKSNFVFLEGKKVVIFLEQN